MKATDSIIISSLRCNIFFVKVWHDIMLIDIAFEFLARAFNKKVHHPWRRQINRAIPVSVKRY